MQPVDTPSPVPHYSVPNHADEKNSHFDPVPIYPPLTHHDVAVNTQNFKAVEHTPPPLIDTDRSGRKLAANPGKADSEGRFLDIDKKLCKMGIGWNVSNKLRFEKLW